MLGTNKILTRLRNGLLAIALFAIQLAGPLTATASAAVNPNAPVANPTLSQSCGLDIALVIDNSTSISNTEMNQMKNAMTSFTNALNGTPTQFSVTKFASSGTVVQNFTSNITTVNNAINGIPTNGGFTNWEDGLKKAGTTLPNRSNPDLVIFASDGDPTISSAGGFDDNQPNAHLEPAIIQANAIKNSGARVLAIGIGNSPSTSRLSQISGPNINTGNVLTSDVITTDFSTLAAELATFASQTCGGTITTTKLIDADGNIQTTNDRTPASGWEFDINGQPSNPAATTTDGTGKTPAVKVSAGTYSVNETAKPGYSLIGATCSGASGNGSKQGNAVVGLSVANNDIVNCTFINSEAKGSVQVAKMLDADGNGTYEGGNSEAQGKNMFWNLDGGANTTFGGSISNVATGTHSVNENSVAGYHFTGWYPTSNTAQQSCANPAGNTLPISVNVNANLTSGVTLCNARDTGTIKVIKKVVNDNGGTKQPGDFSLSLKANDNNVAGSPAAGSLTGVTYNNLPTNTYTVNEANVSGYTQTSIVCKDIQNNTVTHPVVLSRGQNITCTVTNDDKAPTLTVIKNVVNPFGTPLPASSFDLFVDGNVVFSGVPTQAYGAGNHTVSETQKPGYTLEGVSGDCTDNKGIISLMLSLDTNSTCTITNTAIQPKIVVKKVVINDNSGTKQPGDFTMTVTGNSMNVANFAGSTFGTSVGLNEGNYQVGELEHVGYEQTFEGDCSGTIKIGDYKTCTIINNDLPNPKINVIKYGPDTAREGDTVWYDFYVTNTGDTQLTNVNVSDNIATGEVCDTTTLNPGQSTWCYASYVIPTPQVANVVNTVVATGTAVAAQTTVTATDNHTLDVLHPGIKVTKSGPAQAAAGSTVTYTFVVTNSGDTALDNIEVNDDIAGIGVYQSGDINGNNRLDIEETWVYTKEYTIADDQTEPVVNTATACSYENREWEDGYDRVLDSIIIVDRKPVACDTDSHTLTIPVKPEVLGDIEDPKLQVTGQSYALIAAITLAGSLVAATAVSQASKRPVS